MSSLLGWRDGVPVVSCQRWQTGDGVAFIVPQCVFCGGRHLHATTDEALPAACPPDLAPASGYVLALAGQPASVADVARLLRSRQPGGATAPA